jgi:ABC-2 type transport system ATP-binding protein
MTSDYAIDIAHADKKYAGRFGRGGVHALRDITMQVHRGAVFGLLGPNGAGKSTLVKILMTVIRPSRCEGTMLGAPVGDKASLRRVGYLPEHHRFPEYLTASQVLDYFGALSEVPRATRIIRSAELLELVGLRDWSKQKVKGFSKGMRQRLGIANALMGDPDLVVLDEPTDGVDPVGRKDIREVLLKLRDRGKTVFLNSHLLSELEMVCDRVAILVQGTVYAQGTIDDLTRDSKRYEIDIVKGFDQADELGVVLERAAPGGMLPSGAGVRQHGSGIIASTDDPLAVQGLLDTLRSSGYVLKAVRPVRASLEDLFMQAVTDPTTGKALAPGAKQGGKN